MKKTILLVATSVLVLSCNQKTAEQIQMEEAMAVFNENAEVVHALFDSLEKEDLETAATFFTEEAKFNPPAYEGEDFNKTEILQNYSGFFELLNNITATERDFYPSVDTEFIPDGGVRAYVSWTADFNGEPLEGIKAYEVFQFNDENKIIEVDEYMDVSGFVNKITALTSQ